MTKPQPPDPRRVFLSLDAELPLALLPVRIETRFRLAHDPPELLVRIFPDLVHADGHTAALTKAEQDLGRAFWVRSWRAGAGADGDDAAFAWLAGRIGPWRAAWVARRLVPVNGAEAPTRPLPESGPLVPEPRFPAVETVSEGAPTWARLLPERFSVTLLGEVMSEPGLLGTWWGAPIPEEVALAPGAVDVGADPDARDWLAAQGLGWTYDFEAAEAIGLGVRIDLSGFGDEQITNGFAHLVVCGVRGSDQQTTLASLLEGHRYTRGLDFIPQGTPTNTTERSAPGLSLEAPDLAALRAAELTTGKPRARPPLDDDGDLYRLRAGDAAGLGLGLGWGGALDRSTHAGLAELPWAESMHRALWPGLAGQYLDHVLDGVLTDAGRAWLRDWSVAYARGGAPLPTLLIGPQPYGLLPVSLVTRPEAGPRREIEQVEDVLGQLWIPWVAHAEIVPRLDPEAPDVAMDGTGETAGELAARVSKIMGAVPHPTGFRLQRVDPMRSTYFHEWNLRLLLVGLACGSAPEGEPPYPDYTDSPNWSDFVRLGDDLDAAGSSIAQKVALQRFADAMEAPFAGGSDADDAHGETWAAYTREWLVDFVAEHRARTTPLLSLVELAGLTGKLGLLNEPNAFFNVHPADGAATWELPLVAPGRGPEDVSALRGWLDALVAGLDTHLGDDHDFSTAFPLLRQLLRWSIHQATDPGDQAVLRSGLAELVTIAATASDPVGELERLMRETLGLHGYRLDAWFTAVAAWRLENKRVKRPEGIQVGAFGFVCDVKPREAAGPSQGYVLAPSLTHATTAAVLRSGWAALGEAGEGAGLAVDLSSDRVRRARWITEGVRQGQDLGQLLGARFERGLHDAALDRWIDDLRQLALDARGDPAPPNAIVDGLLLARARLGADELQEERDAGAALTTLLAGAAADRAGLETVLDGLAADLDAVADAAVAQSVFSLVEGNVPEATATLTASATGEVTFPELRFADTPRPAQTITYRLLLLLGDEEAPAKATSGRVLASPALDVVYLAPVGEETGLGRLGALLAAWAEGRRPAEAPADAAVELVTNAGDPTVEDLALACRALRRLIAEARDLDGRDLAAPGATEVADGLDTSPLESRVEDVWSALEAAAPGSPARCPRPAARPRAATSARRCWPRPASSSAPACRLPRARRRRASRTRTRRRRAGRPPRSSPKVARCGPRRPSGSAPSRR